MFTGILHYFAYTDNDYEHDALAEERLSSNCGFL